MILFYVGENKEFEWQFFSGEFELELMFQGILVEKFCVGGLGIVVFYIQMGVGIQVVEGGFFCCYGVDGSIVVVLLVKDVCFFFVDGEECEFVFEEVIIIDFLLVYVVCGDWYGNFVFNKVVCNFNLFVVMVGCICIVQVEELVEFGEFDLDVVYFFGVFVYCIIEVGVDILKCIEWCIVVVEGV